MGVTTNKRINPGQLVEHLGTSEGIRVLGDPGSDGPKEIEVDGMSPAALQAALDTYVYDEEHGLPDSQKQLRAVRQKAREVIAGTDTFTPAQMQQLVARLALRELGEE
jgi:hypothetical protein